MRTVEIRLATVCRPYPESTLRAGYVRLDVPVGQRLLPGISVGPYECQAYQDRLFEPVMGQMEWHQWSPLYNLMHRARHPVAVRSRIMVKINALIRQGAMPELDLTETSHGQQLRKDALSLLLVDDLIHVRTIGPVINAFMDYRGGPYPVYTALWSNGLETLQGSRAGMHRFDRLDDLDAALPGNVDAYPVRRHLDVDLLELPDARNLALEGLAYKVCARFSRINLQDATPDQLRAIHGLRKILHKKDGRDPIDNPAAGPFQRDVFSAFRPVDTTGLLPAIEDCLRAASATAHRKEVANSITEAEMHFLRFRAAGPHLAAGDLEGVAL